MNTKKIVAILVIALTCTAEADAQFIKNLGEKAVKKAKEKIENKVERSVDEGADAVLDPKKKDKNNRQTETVTETPTEATEGVTETPENAVKKPAAAIAKNAEAAYAKTDFVPGDEIFFDDDVTNEQVGEFPSKWDFISGTECEVAKLNGEKVIHIDGWHTYIAPLMKEKDYLPNEFTLEMDVWSSNLEGVGGNHGIGFYFYNADGDQVGDIEFGLGRNEKECGGSGLLYTSNNGDAREIRVEDLRQKPLLQPNSWTHVAISFNKRSFKAYINGTRIMNVPNMAAPTSLKMKCATLLEEGYYFKNFRLCKGAVPLYDRMMSDGKIVTYAITFDVGKANIKPESMTEIMRIQKLMQENPSLKFEVQGHTDATGNAASNQTLSENRAKAIVAKLVELGIASNRLTAVGKGQTTPIADNTTDEGRAKNRRVEFVKK